MESICKAQPVCFAVSFVNLCCSRTEHPMIHSINQILYTQPSPLRTWLDVLCALPVRQRLKNAQQLHPCFLPSPPFKCMLLSHACTAPIPTPAWANTHDRSGTPSGSNPSNSPVPGTRPKTSAASSNPYAPSASRQASPAAGGGGARVGAGAGSGGTAAAARSPQDAAAPGSAGAGVAGTSDAQVLRTAGSSWPVRALEV